LSGVWFGGGGWVGAVGGGGGGGGEGMELGSTNPGSNARNVSSAQGLNSGYRRGVNEVYPLLYFTQR